jgi:quercetin dioxygenase-like cupin family protein
VGIHPSGEKRPGWTADDQRTTLVLLVKGHFVVHLTEGDASLTDQGGYVVWVPGIDHSWEAVSDSIVLTVRWPSLYIAR